MTRQTVIGLIGLVAVGIAAGAAFLIRGEPSGVQAQVTAPAVQDSSGFEQVTGPTRMRFPEAHGAHPEYQTEWWYFTGNLRDVNGRRFGYQFTLFRRALAPANQVVERPSEWATVQVYMAHFTLSDINGRRHYAFERIARGAAGLAGVRAQPFRAWLEDWSIEETPDGLWHLRAAQEGIHLDLRLVDQKGPVLQGDQGYSQKGPEPGSASTYYSLTRIAAEGRVTLPGGMVFEVDGTSWMDHEYSTSALAEDQVGWDWFSIQLDDGTELMLYYLRREDGSIDSLSQGTYVTADGASQPLIYADGDFRIDPGRTWRSTQSGGEYPVAWEVLLPTLDMTLHIEALLDDQENRLSFAYWEGAVSVAGERAAQPVSGVGYVEMTGYATSMAGQF